jgi:hypothetical protein
MKFALALLVVLPTIASAASPYENWSRCTGESTLQLTATEHVILKNKEQKQSVRYTLPESQYKVYGGKESGCIFDLTNVEQKPTVSFRNDIVWNLDKVSGDDDAVRLSFSTENKKAKGMSLRVSCNTKSSDKYAVTTKMIRAQFKANDINFKCME